MKICRKCFSSEPSVSFYTGRRVCKLCHAAQGYQWKSENKETWLGIVRKSKNNTYVLDKDPILERNKVWRLTNPEKK